MKIRAIFAACLLTAGTSKSFIPAIDAGELAKSASPLTLYVAPDGNDRWSGQLAAPTPERSDGPLASLEGARDRIRALRQATNPGPITVWVGGGTYRLKAPFILEPRDSGSVEGPVLYAAMHGEQPVFSGGEVISGLRQQGSRELGKTDVSWSAATES